MSMGRRAGWTERQRLAVLTVVVSVLTCLLLYPFTSAAGPSGFKTVVLLYSETDNGSPGNVLLNRSIRATELLRRKYAGREVDLLIAFLPASLDLALKNRESLFPRVPIVYLGVSAEITIDSRPSSGTRIDVHLPLGATELLVASGD